MKLICYLSGGYPTMDKSVEMAMAYVDGGCDAIEWNFPPENPYMETDYIAEKMAVARKQCDDYRVYMERLAEFKRSRPQAEIIPMLYQETVKEIGGEELGRFCQECGIDTIITADIREPQILHALEAWGVGIAPFVSFQMREKEVQMALESRGFIYMQAMPFADENMPDFDGSTLKRCIRVLRDMGVDRQIYCGGGIRTEEHVRHIRESGGDGFFLGSSVMQYYDEPERLKEVIQAFKRAAE